MHDDADEDVTRARESRVLSRAACKLPHIFTCPIFCLALPGPTATSINESAVHRPRAHKQAHVDVN